MTQPKPPRPAPLLDPGPMPVMEYLHKSKLTVDRRYQRELSEKRSVKLIERLKSTFRYAHCAPLIVTDNADGTYCIIDGQHRWKAALALPKVAKLPCYIVDEMTLREQARAFVAHNRDRVAMNQLAIFHALAASGDEHAVALRDACTLGGVTILKSPKIAKTMAAGETMALGTLEWLMTGKLGFPGGAHVVTQVCKILRAAYADKKGQLTSRMIKAAVKLLETQIAPDAVVALLRSTDDAALDAAARAAVRKDATLKLQDAYTAALKAKAARRLEAA